MVRVRSDAQEWALVSSFAKITSDDFVNKDVATDDLAYVLPDPEQEEKARRFRNESRARYYLRPGIEFHADLDDSVAGGAIFKDPLVRDVAATPGNASMMTAALAIVIMSNFGKCFRPYGRARKKSKKKTPVAVTTPPESVDMCRQSSIGTDAAPAPYEIFDEESAAADAAKDKAEVKKGLFVLRGWRIKGAYWSREWVGAKDEVWRRWLHVLVEVLPGRAPPSFEDLFDMNAFPDGQMVTIGDVWRKEMEILGSQAEAA